jgi:hypothetical protein
LLDDELGPLRTSIGIIALTIDTKAQCAVPLPYDNEATGCVHRYGRSILIPDRRGIDFELSPLFSPERIEPLCEDTIAAAIAEVAGPGNDEISGSIHGGAGDELITLGCGVDLEPRAGRCRCEKM